MTKKEEEPVIIQKKEAKKEEKEKEETISVDIKGEVKWQKPSVSIK